MWRSLAYYTSLAVETVLGVVGIRLYEQPAYKVIDRVADIEIRLYSPRLAAEVVLPSDGERGRSAAFRLLFNYIAGANRTSAGKSRIAMTAPVAVNDNRRQDVKPTGRDAGLMMRFFLPAKYDMNSAPTPSDPRVHLRFLPADTFAALRYAGKGDPVRRQSDLMSRLSRGEWRPSGEPFSQFYDAPFTLPPFRRNEALVPVTRTGAVARDAV